MDPPEVAMAEHEDMQLTLRGRMTRKSSKRQSKEIAADGDGPDGPDAPPPLKSGLTEIMGSAAIDKPQTLFRRGSNPAKVPPSPKVKGGINDKAQRAKWANKRDEIRSKRRGSTAAGSSADSLTQST